jgi:hypothetical protein
LILGIWNPKPKDDEALNDRSGNISTYFQELMHASFCYLEIAVRVRDNANQCLACVSMLILDTPWLQGQIRYCFSKNTVILPHPRLAAREVLPSRVLGRSPGDRVQYHRTWQWAGGRMSGTPLTSNVFAHLYSPNINRNPRNTNRPFTAVSIHNAH